MILCWSMNLKFVLETVADCRIFSGVVVLAGVVQAGVGWRGTAGSSVWSTKTTEVAKMCTFEMHPVLVAITLNTDVVSSNWHVPYAHVHFLVGPLLPSIPAMIRCCRSTDAGI